MTQSIRRRVEGAREQTLQPSAIQSVEYDTHDGQHLAFTAQDIRKAICPLADDKDLMMFLSLCKAQQLNPFTREAYLIKYSQSKPAQMVVGKDVFYKRAESNPHYRGIKSGVVYIDMNGQVQKRKGQAVYGVANETLVGAWAEVYREDRTQPVYVEVSLEEYRGSEKSLWKDKPATMLVKVAEVQALRRAFPDMGQLYFPEEMDSPEVDISGQVEMDAQSVNVDAETGEIYEELGTVAVEPEEVTYEDEQGQLFASDEPTEPEYVEPGDQATITTPEAKADNSELWTMLDELTGKFGFDKTAGRNALRQRYEAGGIEHARRYMETIREANSR